MPIRHGLWSQSKLKRGTKIVDAVHARGSRLSFSYGMLVVFHILIYWMAIFLSQLGSAIQPQVKWFTASKTSFCYTSCFIAFENPRKSSHNINMRLNWQKWRVLMVLNYMQPMVDLIDQFLQSTTNHRDDEYGGSIENRTFTITSGRCIY